MWRVQAWGGSSGCNRGVFAAKRERANKANKATLAPGLFASFARSHPLSVGVLSYARLNIKLTRGAGNMPVSRKRKPKKSQSKRAAPQQSVTFDSLSERMVEFLQRVEPEDLDSVGLAFYYVMVAPQRDINQCVTAATVLMLARKMLGAESEVVPAVVSYPKAGKQWGRPDPQLVNEDQTDGHVVLVTDTGRVIDVTAGQFDEFAASRNGLPVIGRDLRVWKAIKSAVDSESRPTLSPIATAQFVLQGNDTVVYDLHHPFLALDLTMSYLERSDQAGLTAWVDGMLKTYAWIIGNLILVGSRADEVDRISNARLAAAVRQLTGKPQPSWQ